MLDNLKLGRQISIHALRGEDDVYRTIYSSSQPGQFQSTPSVGRATCDECWNEPMNDISIHALRGEGDRSIFITTISKINFNPRPPWGGRRLQGLICRRDVDLFQSTPSVGRATR